jgi:hypothetical protein
MSHLHRAVSPFQSLVDTERISVMLRLPVNDEGVIDVNVIHFDPYQREREHVHQMKTVGRVSDFEEDARSLRFHRLMTMQAFFFSSPLFHYRILNFVTIEQLFVHNINVAGEKERKRKETHDILQFPNSSAIDDGRSCELNSTTFSYFPTDMDSKLCVTMALIST